MNTFSWCRPAYRRRTLTLLSSPRLGLEKRRAATQNSTVGAAERGERSVRLREVRDLVGGIATDATLVALGFGDLTRCCPALVGQRLHDNLGGDLLLDGLLAGLLATPRRLHVAAMLADRPEDL